MSQLNKQNLNQQDLDFNQMKSAGFVGRQRGNIEERPIINGDTFSENKLLGQEKFIDKSTMKDIKQGAQQTNLGEQIKDTMQNLGDKITSAFSNIKEAVMGEEKDTKKERKNL